MLASLAEASDRPDVYLSRFEFAERLQRRDKLVLAVVDDVATKAAIQKSRCCLLMKPFDDNDLLAAIAEAMDTLL